MTWSRRPLVERVGTQALSREILADSKQTLQEFLQSAVKD